MGLDAQPPESGALAREGASVSVQVCAKNPIEAFELGSFPRAFKKGGSLATKQLPESVYSCEFVCIRSHLECWQGFAWSQQPAVMHSLVLEASSFSSESR